jgi:hypothetical protein
MNLRVDRGTRAVNSPNNGLNISMDFNAAPGGGARGTEVIIPDNASPQLRAAAADYNSRVVAFAAANGISNYPNRGVRTRSQNGRGVRNTVHTEPFFNDDLAMSQAIRNNPGEFAAIYQESFGNIDATLIPPHGVGRDRGAVSSVFGDETSFGELMVDQIEGGAADAGSGLGDVPVDDPIAGDGFTDFGGDLSQEEYLSNQNAADPDLQGSPADIERFIIPAAIENTLKEIICGLAGGGGLKLPNKQICINHAINALLGQIAGIASQALQGAIGALAGAFQNFMSHLNLDAVLGRINGVLGQISNLANMINFCSAPVDPIQIPNVLQNAMGSFLGKGMDIMNKIGSIPTPNIGGCTSGGFNPGIFDGGVLKTIGDNLDDLSLVEDIILADIEEIVTDIEDLIADETNVPTEYSSGGSDFLEGDRPVWDGVSVLFNAQDEGIAGATRNGSALWSVYQQLGSYQVKDLDGNVYNNIFELFVDDDLLRLLRRTPNPQPDIIEREPILNYCGETVGFREIVKQRAPQRSRGTPPATESDQPGFNAGGISTNPLSNVGVSSTTTISEAINNTQDTTPPVTQVRVETITNTSPPATSNNPSPTSPPFFHGYQNLFLNTLRVNSGIWSGTYRERELGKINWYFMFAAMRYAPDLFPGSEIQDSVATALDQAVVAPRMNSTNYTVARVPVVFSSGKVYFLNIPGTTAGTEPDDSNIVDTRSNDPSNPNSPSEIFVYDGTAIWEYTGLRVPSEWKWFLADVQENLRDFYAPDSTDAYAALTLLAAEKAEVDAGWLNTSSAHPGLSRLEVLELLAQNNMTDELSGTAGGPRLASTFQHDQDPRVLGNTYSVDFLADNSEVAAGYQALATLLTTAGQGAAAAAAEANYTDVRAGVLAFMESGRFRASTVDQTWLTDAGPEAFVQRTRFALWPYLYGLLESENDIATYAEAVVSYTLAEILPGVLFDEIDTFPITQWYYAAWKLGVPGAREAIIRRVTSRERGFIVITDVVLNILANQ